MTHYASPLLSARCLARPALRANQCPRGCVCARGARLRAEALTLTLTLTAQIGCTAESKDHDHLVWRLMSEIKERLEQALLVAANSNTNSKGGAEDEGEAPPEPLLSSFGLEVPHVPEERTQFFQARVPVR